MAKASRLAKVKGGVLDEGLRFLFYSVEGFGKTTLAAHSPAPISIDCEDSSGKVDIKRYPFRQERGGHVPRTFEDVLEAVEDLSLNEHPHRTLVIDTVDRLESLIWASVCRRHSEGGKAVASIEEFGYGKGYTYALDAWRDFARRLDELRTGRGLHVILLGHAQIRTFKDPEGEDYDRYQLRVNEKASGFLREWADVVGFGRFSEFGAKLPGGGKRVKAAGSGQRMLAFHRRPAYDAKTRLPLPAELALPDTNPWAPIARAVEESRMNAERLVELIEGEKARIGDVELSYRVDLRVKGADGNRATLLRFLRALREKPSAAEPTTSPAATESAVTTNETAEEESASV